MTGVTALDDFPLSDDDLAAEALAADPDRAVDADAVPFGQTDPASVALLPEWYMPAPTGLRHGRGRAVVAVFVLALLAANAAGLCVTYGIPEIAW